MDTAFVILVFVVILGLAFDYVNGFHDTANAIATVVATRVLSPLQAVLMAATMNFIGALSGTAVASTVGAGIATGGVSVLGWEGIQKVLAGLVVSPTSGSSAPSWSW